GARLAPPAPDVEREPPGTVAPDTSLRALAVEVTDVVERADVGGRVRPRRSADRRLVDVDDLVDVLPPDQLPVLPGNDPRPVHLDLERPVQHVLHQRGLPGTAHAGHADQRAEREGHVDVLQVVLARSLDPEPFATGLPADLRGGDGTPATQVRAGQRVFLFQQSFEVAGVDDLAAQLPCPRPDVHD